MISDREQTMIDAVAVLERWVEYTATRESDREFDIRIEGTHTQFGSPCRFSAILRLAAIHSMCDWCSDAVASMCDYPSMAADGDWSSIRDTNEDAQWRIFDTFIVPQITVQSALAKVRKKMNVTNS